MNLDVHGARIIFQKGGFVLTETVVNTWIIMAVIVGLCLFLTHGMQVHCRTKRQIIAEWIVKSVNNMVGENMGERFLRVGYAPLICSIMGLSALCSLSSMVGMYAPTSDLSTLLGWSLMVFVLITYNKFRVGGPLGYIKGYFDPIPILFPFNVISEVATPLSMAFRHFGNIASGSLASAGGAGIGAGADTAFTGRHTGDILDLLRPVLFLLTGIHLLHADDDVHRRGGGGLSITHTTNTCLGGYYNE